MHIIICIIMCKMWLLHVIVCIIMRRIQLLHIPLVFSVLTYLLSEFNHEPVVHTNADIDGNGIVNAADLTFLLAGFNKRAVEVEK